MADKTKKDDIAAMSFEAAMAELEQIVAALEKGDVELEASISIYERGEALRARCDALLKKAEAKVLADYSHGPCGGPPVKRGRLDLTLTSLFGKIKVPRQRLYCKRCQRWLVPLNALLERMRDGPSRTTHGFCQLAGLQGTPLDTKLVHLDICPESNRALVESMLK